MSWITRMFCRHEWNNPPKFEDVFLDAINVGCSGLEAAMAANSICKATCAKCNKQKDSNN